MLSALSLSAEGNLGESNDSETIRNPVAAHYLFIISLAHEVCTNSTMGSIIGIYLERVKLDLDLTSFRNDGHSKIELVHCS